MMNKKTIGVIGLGTAAVIAGAAMFYKGQPASETADAGVNPAVTSTDPAFAKSLSGTTPDGALRSTPTGELVVDEALIERFDYYLTTLGERTLAEIRSEVERSLDKELSPKSAAEAKRLFGKYLDFKQAVKSLTPEPATGSPVDIVRARRASLLALRAKYFSPAEITALFGKNDLLENDAFARLDIERNSNLTAAQKKAQLAELDARLPKEIREGRAPDAKHHALVDAEREARANGATDAQIFQVRAEHVGVEAAQRLADLDKEEAAWKARIDAYLAEKKKVMAYTGMAEADRLSEVKKLQERSFNEQERLRLGAYE